MVKKRLFFLVILQVASILVSSQDDFVEAVDGFDAPEPPPVEIPVEAPVEVDGPEVLGDPTWIDMPPVVDEQPAPIIYDPIPKPESPEEQVFDPPSDSIEPEVEVYTVRTTRRRKKTRTTTPAPLTPCIELEPVIAAREEAFSHIPEGYTADQCFFNIVNEENCEWTFLCSGFNTETPTEPPPPETEDSEESAEDEVEPCEPKKKFKFENCFLKIRGIIKKKKPTRC